MRQNKGVPVGQLDSTQNSEGEAGVRLCCGQTDRPLELPKITSAHGSRAKVLNGVRGAVVRAYNGAEITEGRLNAPGERGFKSFLLMICGGVARGCVMKRAES